MRYVFFNQCHVDQLFNLYKFLLNFARAAHETWGDSLREYQCVDVSQDMNSLAEYLIRGLYFMIMNELLILNSVCHSRQRISSLL